MEEYLWIIGGGILQVPLIEEVNNLNYGVIVTDADSNCICKNKASYFEAIDIFNIDEHIKYANFLVNKGIKIIGVLAAGIDAPETMSRVAEYLNLPSVSSDVAHLVNNKELFRIEMKRLGIPVPKFRILTKDLLSQLTKIIDEIGYPLIVKNTSSSGSRGTKIFYTPDYDGVYSMTKEAISVSRSKKALIESLWDGSEHTVETLYDIKGKFHRCFITDRLFNKSSGFAIETGLVHPSKLSDHEQNKMYLLAEKVSSAIGVNQGAAKFDIIQTEDGPRIIEMTVRLSGGFDCQYLVPIATGKNILKAAILTAIGETFSDKLLENTRGRVALSESIWPLPGKIIKIDGVESAKKLKGFEYIYFKYAVGDTIELFTDCSKRVCYIIASGDNYSEALENISTIKSSIKISVE